ncbi:UNVERIFIED_CONTAM: hypothetical protein FKN15_004853 [Acipenser sinensis]
MEGWSWRDGCRDLEDLLGGLEDQGWCLACGVYGHTVAICPFQDEEEEPTHERKVGRRSRKRRGRGKLQPQQQQEEVGDDGSEDEDPNHPTPEWTGGPRAFSAQTGTRYLRFSRVSLLKVGFHDPALAVRAYRIFSQASYWGACTRAAMVESTSGNCASPTTSAPSIEASVATLLETLGAEAGCYQEALTSSRKSGNTGSDWGFEVYSGLNTDLCCLETAFQGTWRKFAARSIITGVSGSEASSELGTVNWVRSVSQVSSRRKDSSFQDAAMESASCSSSLIVTSCSKTCGAITGEAGVCYAAHGAGAGTGGTCFLLKCSSIWAIWPINSAMSLTCDNCALESAIVRVINPCEQWESSEELQESSSTSLRFSKRHQSCSHSNWLFSSEVLWKATPEQCRSVFRPAQASTPQPFPVFLDFLEEVQSTWHQPASVQSVSKHASPLASLESVRALGLVQFPLVDSTIAAPVRAPLVGGLSKDPVCPNGQ